MKTTGLGLWNRVCPAACLTVLLLAFGLEAQQGHTITGTQIRMNNRSHWEAWDVAGGIVDITQEGSVRPNFMRKNINAALNAEKFSFTSEGGVVAVLNQGEAGNLIDGDINTTWGPDPDSPLGDWAVTLHLGRMVIAHRIVVRFGEEGQGDPFLQFKVLVWRQGPSRAWDRDYTLQGTDIPNFWEIGRTIKPNKTEKVFEFSPGSVGQQFSTQGGHGQRLKDAAFVGDPIERVQIVATDSDFDHAQEVSKEDYDNLPQDKKGAVDYYRRGLSGQEYRVSKQVYDNFDDPARKGSIKYYRKEIPRVAEIEVWTLGDNLNLGAGERGGILTIETNAGPKDLSATVTDGNNSTGHNGTVFGGKVYEFFEDLGALFWVDTQQFLAHGADVFQVDISDGTLAPDGSIKWTRIGESRAQRDFREFRHDPAKVRFVRVVFGHSRWNSYAGFTEVMYYGQGFVPEVELTSDLIQLGGEKNLISIEWEADAPPGTSVEVQTRTGNTLLEEKIFHDSKGNVVTEKRYKKLPKKKKGEITSFFKASPDWVPWSTAYAFSGEVIKSPSPREYLLVRARLLSDDPDIAATLKSITVNMSDPLADQVLGEVSPNRIQAIGQAEDFSYFIQPVFGSSRQGFDEIMIEASTGTLMELAEVRLGSQDDFGAGQPQVFTRDQVEVLADGADTLWLRLPEAVGRGVGLIEVKFRPQIFANSASFRTSIQDSGNPGFWQRVDEGDATDLVDSQVVTVLALEGNEVIKDMRLDSALMTPNGDGINDALVFHFDVARINAAKSVKLTIYDLSGEKVGEVLEQRPDPRGSYALAWPGTNAAGQVVPPGIYIARIEVDVDSDAATSTAMDRMVYVAY